MLGSTFAGLLKRQECQAADGATEGEPWSFAGSSDELAGSLDLMVGDVCMRDRKLNKVGSDAPSSGWSSTGSERPGSTIRDGC